MGGAKRGRDTGLGIDISEHMGILQSIEAILGKGPRVFNLTFYSFLSRIKGKY